MASRVAVIGLDCVPPSLLFERWRGRLPHLDELARNGVWGTLRSCDPPITVPAWQVMVTGRDPGELGLYGFRDRRSPAYDDVHLADSHSIAYPRLWDWLGRAGLRSIVLGVPMTYPPQPLRGSLVSCFLTPSRQSEYTYPRSLKSEIEARFPDYQFDVGEFRNTDRTALLQRIYRMTEQHFALANYMIEREDWQFFMMVEMGPDRLHHAFWGEEQNSESVLFEYYRYLDAQVGALVDALPYDTLILVVSDHGAQTMHGGFHINQWLIERGALVLKGAVEPGTPLRPELVDWTRTRVWADGGYCGRLFINQRDREPQGIVAAAESDGLVQELIADLEAVTTADGHWLGNQAFRPAQKFHCVEGFAPDIMLYSGGLAWRVLGSIGHESLFAVENDTGADGANHHPDGIVIMSDRTAVRCGEPIFGCGLLDITPTILRSLDVAIPEGLRGRALDWPRVEGHQAHVG